MVEDKREGDVPPPRDAQISDLWHWGVAQKLWLAFGLLLLVLVVSGVVSYRYIQQIDRDLRQVVEIEEPLEQAVLEMEINAEETARAVFSYLRNFEPEDLVVMLDSEVDFEGFAARFERLAETAEEQRLGREVATLYADFKTLGDEIVTLADEQYALLQTIRKSVKEIDQLIDEKLQQAIDMTAPDGLKKLHSALEMEINIDEAFAAIEGYVLHPDAALRAEAADAMADLERFEASYRETDLSAEETTLLDRIDRDFTDSVKAGKRIMAVTDELREKLRRFEDDLTTIDALLDDRIQPLIHAETILAAGHATTSIAAARFWLIVLGAVAISIAGGSGWAITRGIVTPVKALMRGAEIVGGGRLDHKIDVRTRDEFGHLTDAFNRMAANLDLSAKSLHEAHQGLELRVEDRTRELHESEQRFKDFAEAASDWQWETDPDGAFTYVDRRYFETMRVAPESVIGKLRESFVGAAQLEADPEMWRRHFGDLEARRPFRDFE